MKKILVVDDNKMNLKIAKKVLAGGYEIVQKPFKKEELLAKVEEHL